MESPVTYARHHKFIMGTLTVAVILGFAIGARFIGRKPVDNPTNTETKVTLVSAKDFLKDRGTVSANGTIEAQDQAELRSQAAGPVTSIKSAIGKHVVPGQVLVTLQNSDIAAGLAQTQAVLKSQQARLDEMRRGARNEQIALAQSAVNAAQQALADTKTTQDALVANAYSALLNSGLTLTPGVHNTSQARLSLSGSYLLTKEGTYTITFPQGGDKPPFSVSGIETTSGWIVNRGSAQALGASGLYMTVSADGDIFPGDFWTVTIPNPQALSYAAARNNYETVKKARDAAIDGATNALAAAQKSYDLTLAGASNEQLTAQEAVVEQAAAAVAATAVQLEKTIIRSPIDGVVASLPVKYGELVSPGTLVASVVGKGGLVAKAYLSDYDLPYVKEGALVSVNGTATGTITHLSPSIDPLTKNIEIRVTINDAKNSGLVVGQNASLKISASTLSSNQGRPVFLVPLQAIKVSNSGASVFTVASGTLREHAIKLGTVSGEQVEVTDGLTPEMQIVSTAYELKDGEPAVTE